MDDETGGYSSSIGLPAQFLGFFLFSVIAKNRSVLFDDQGHVWMRQVAPGYNRGSFDSDVGL